MYWRIYQINTKTRKPDLTRNIETVHTSAKARLTIVAPWIRIRIRDPDRHQNLIFCSLAKLPWKFHANPFGSFWVKLWQTDRQTDRQTGKQTNNDDYIFSLADVTNIKMPNGVFTVWILPIPYRISQKKRRCALPFIVSSNVFVELNRRKLLKIVLCQKNSSGRINSQSISFFRPLIVDQRKCSLKVSIVPNDAKEKFTNFKQLPVGLGQLWKYELHCS